MEIVGVLALQGDVREHRMVFERLGNAVREVRLPGELEGLRALVLPGGESTAISKLLVTSGLFETIGERLERGSLTLFGTCAGMILAARSVSDGVPDQRSFGVLDAAVRRNGLGRQQQSREVEIEIAGFDAPYPAVMIRPPIVEQVGKSVEVLASYGNVPVLCAQGSHLFATFHPELTDDDRVHRLFLERLNA